MQHATGNKQCPETESQKGNSPQLCWWMLWSPIPNSCSDVRLRLFAAEVDRGYGGERVVEVSWPRIVVAKGPGQKNISDHMHKNTSNVKQLMR
jgi:hypothetical protein